MKNTKCISQSRLKEMILKNQKVIIVDVRSQEEFKELHIPNAINITIEELESRKLDFEEEIIIVTVCGKGGGRSESAAKYIQSNYSNPVYFLEGGTFGWFDETLK